MARRASHATPCALALAALSVLVGVQPTASADDAATVRSDGRLRLDRLSEAWSTLDAADLSGRVVSARTFSGRVVVVDFWATWCAPCLAELPWLRRIREEFGSDRVEVLGVNLDVSDRRTLMTWLNRQRIDWPQVYDGRGYAGELARRFEVTSLPTLVVVDAQGQVVAANLRGERLYAAVGALLAETVP